MDAELAALASAGATTLVGAMVSDAWAQVRDRVAGFFRRGGESGDFCDELDASRAELEAARQEGDADAAADIEALWRNRLRRTLRSDPEAAGALREVLESLQSTAVRSGNTIVNSVSGGVQNAPVVQGQTFFGTTFHAAPPAMRPRPDGGEG